MIMELSNRLETIASFVTEGYVVADIGTDHGYIPIYLTSNGNCPRAYAMDVNKEPLSRAKTHIEEENAGEVVSCILFFNMCRFYCNRRNGWRSGCQNLRAGL